LKKIFYFLAFARKCNIATFHQREGEQGARFGRASDS